MKRRAVQLRLFSLPTLAVLALCALPAATAPAAVDGLQAPTRLHPPPRVSYLLRLPGDLVTVHYAPGTLARAARVQLRLESLIRAFDRWTDKRLQVSVYLLSRQDWEDSGYRLAYGLPLRVGATSLAIPSTGDEGTARLWSELMGGILPRVATPTLQGTPQEAGTMELADLLAQLLAAEILVDELGLVGDRPWVRGLMTHLAAVEFLQRKAPSRLSDLNTMHALTLRERGLKAMSVRDYDADLDLRDWLYFQAQFHFGAQTILQQVGKGGLKKMRKLSRRDDGVLRGERLLREFKGLAEWHRKGFSAVSTRTGP